MSQVEWRQGCCGDQCKYAEVQQATGGWLQLWDHDGVITCLKYDHEKKLIDIEKVTLTSEELDELIKL